MSYTPVSTETFGGLNLVDDPAEVSWKGAVDLLNVDLATPGVVRSRPGYVTYNSGSPAADRYIAATYLQRYSGTNNILAYRQGATTTNMSALADAGTGLAETATFSIASTAGGTDPIQAAVFGTSGASNLWAFVTDPTGSGTALRLKLLGTVAWDRPVFTGGEAPDSSSTLLAVTPWDNRLVFGRASGDPSRLKFSDPGDPINFPTNNFISLGPNRESIAALCTWQNLMFAFAGSGAVYVFFGTSTDSDGNPIFNYRRFQTGGPGPTGPSAVWAGADGVYFVTARGLFRTTGNAPVELSRAIRPVFTDSSTSGLYNGTFALASSVVTQVGSHILVAGKGYTSAGSVSVNGLWLLHSLETGSWMVWQLPNGGDTVAVAPDDASGSIFFPNLSGDLGFARLRWTSAWSATLTPGATTDNGTDITSRYRSGFNTVAPGNRADGRRVIRQWHLRGSGTVDFGVAADDATAIPSSGGGAASSVSLTAPRPNYRTAQRGNNFSWQVSGTGAWQLDSIRADLA